jgi:hypothetical protein
MDKIKYPRLERAGHDIEVPAPRRGRPGYRWVTGWVVKREYATSIPMRLREAQAYLRELRSKS